jgi:hyperosmotically inducible protein
MKTCAWIVLLTSVVSIAPFGCDQKPATSATGAGSAPPNATPAADNTASNKGDGDRAAKTPMDQGQSAPDIKITADIRRSVMDDKAMSINAKNCKIITDKGVVTLRGVVDNKAERDSIESSAKGIAGVNRVDNQLEIKTP